MGRGIAIVAAGIVLLAADGARAAEQELVTRVELRSEPGDSVGDGGTFAYTPEDAEIRIGGSPTFIGFDVNRSEEDLWEGTFTPPSGGRLEPGRYTGATRHPFNSPGPGMMVSYETGCNELSGEFTIVSIGYDGDRISSLHLEFVQHCENLPPALRGTLLYNVPDPAAAADEPEPEPQLQPATSAPPPQLEATIRHRFRATRRGTVVRRLRVVGPRHGVTVQIRCSRGRGSCPFGRRRTAGANLARLFDGHRLRRGTVIAIRLTKPGSTGRYLRFTIRSSRPPLVREGQLRSSSATDSMCGVCGNMSTGRTRTSR